MIKEITIIKKLGYKSINHFWLDWKNNFISSVGMAKYYNLDVEIIEILLNYAYKKNTI